jgi:hypothetical protein
VSLPEWRDLFPEGIAYDPKDGAIYLSSLRQHLILQVKRDPGGSVDPSGLVPTTVMSIALDR